MGYILASVCREFWEPYASKKVCVGGSLLTRFFVIFAWFLWAERQQEIHSQVCSTAVVLSEGCVQEERAEPSTTRQDDKIIGAFDCLYTLPRLCRKYLG